MTAIEVMDRLRDLGVSLTLDGDELVVRPGSRIPPGLVPELERCTGEIIDYLGRPNMARRYQRLYPGEAAGAEELAAMVQRLQSEGVLLTYCSVLDDYVGFYLTEAHRERVPAGFTPYSHDELLLLFGDADRQWTPVALRHIHHAKKMGAGPITDVFLEPNAERSDDA